MARTMTDPEDTPEQRLRMSYEGWRAWYGAVEGQRGEWVDGEVIVFRTPGTIHQLIFGSLIMPLARYADDADLGQVILGPVEMYLRSVPAARTPDILFVASAHASRVTDDRIDGPADLVVEIVSEDSGRRDWDEKLREYASVGIPEYWIVDSRIGQWRVAFFQLSADGAYRAMPVDAEGCYHSKVLPGFRLDPTSLWQDPLLTRIAGERSQQS